MFENFILSHHRIVIVGRRYSVVIIASGRDTSSSDFAVFAFDVCFSNGYRTRICGFGPTTSIVVEVDRQVESALSRDAVLLGVNADVRWQLIDQLQ